MSLGNRKQAPKLGAGLRANHDYIARWLPRKGHRWVAEKLGLKPKNVWAYGDRHGFKLGDIPGMVRVSGVAAAAGVDIGTVWSRAKREGVMRKAGPPKATGRAIVCLVPEKWAEAFLAEYDALNEGAELMEAAGWLTVSELVTAWKVGRGTIQRGMNGRGVLAPLLADVRQARARGHKTGGKILVNPWDAEAVRRRLEDDRHRAKQLVATKTVSVECGVKQGYAADVGRELGGELLFVHGRLMCHVTPRVAAVMRERFAQRWEKAA